MQSRDSTAPLTDVRVTCLHLLCDAHGGTRFTIPPKLCSMMAQRRALRTSRKLTTHPTSVPQRAHFLRTNKMWVLRNASINCVWCNLLPSSVMESLAYRVSKSLELASYIMCPMSSLTVSLRRYTPLASSSAFNVAEYSPKS